MRYPRRRIQPKEEKNYIFGRFIRESKVYCIDHNNQNLGLIDTREGLRIAQEAGLELVLVSQGKKGKPSTCKILDFGKYKYEQEKREKVAKKKQRENAIKTKEVKFRPTTDDNDLLTKANHLKDFLEEGNKIKVTVVFKGRELAHKEVGIEKLNRFAELLGGKFETQPSMLGKNLNAILVK